MCAHPTEKETRQRMIDHQLAQAGWSLEQRNLLEEFLLSEGEKRTLDKRKGYQAGGEFVDYVLLGRDSRPLAIVEAKRTGRDPLVGERQAADYADRIHSIYGADPFIFLANGEQIWFWDRERYPVRQVSGFFTREELERLTFQRKHRQPLTSLSPRKEIVDRLYQIEAIKRVTESLEEGKRKFLLVMATGTGKTRTAIALIDLLMCARWVQRILFLADRRELVRQALGDFKEHVSHETRARIEGGEVDHGARIHVATYPSMMQVYQELSPGYYDFIVADESHRSIYNRYKVLLEHFDALQLGLTATPTDYIDHNTFELFDCPDGLPTFNYPYEQAVGEDYLADYKVLEAQTTFQIQGIKASQLPPEFQRQLVEQGIELSEINFEGSDLERRVTNVGTNNAIVREFMETCRRDASGTVPAKSIFFAMSHRHAMEIYHSFNRLYPDLQRRGLARVIDSHVERADRTLDDFKRTDMPRVAISVDMLDTGIDVPAIQNLVFAKPVFSQVKFWQMIGRGTRLWTDPQTGKEKEDFLIIDFWNNFAYFNMNPMGEIAKPTEPLPVRLFRLRLEKLALLRGQGETEAAASTVVHLQGMLAQIPGGNVNVRPHLAELAKLAQLEVWDSLDANRIDYLSRTIAPLLRFLPDVNLQVMTFEARTEQLAVAYLGGQVEQVEDLRERIVEDLGLLPTSLQEVQAQAEKLTWMSSRGFWEHLDYGRILDLQITFAPLMRYRRRRQQDIIHLNLPDRIVSRYWIVYGPSGEGAFVQSYREQVEAFVRSLSEQHPALRKLRQGQSLTETDIQELARALNQADLFVTEDVLRQVYEQPDATLVDFLRHILGLSRLPSRGEQIKGAFDEFITARPHFNATQIMFLRTVRSAVLRQAKLTTQDLTLPPFSRIGDAQRLFTNQELAEVLEFANQFASP